jgi:DNA-binding FadR family transcriptional regulator
MSDLPADRMQIRQPRVAELIAGVLRDRILRGELEDGGELPKQEDLVSEFNVSLPSIREAFRILETEGLVTVRRGNRGGAIVHRPGEGTAAYMLALVLQVEGVTVGELAAALRALEPISAGMCAAREDRLEEVLPQLEASQAQAEVAIDDGAAFVSELRRFHELIGACAGNGAMRIALGTFEKVWSGHEHAWATRAQDEGTLPDREVRERSLREHQEIIDAIRAGDVEAATRLERDHLEHAQPYTVAPGDEDKPLVASQLGVIGQSRPRRGPHGGEVAT